MVMRRRVYYRRKRSIPKFISPPIVRYGHVVIGNLGLTQTLGCAKDKFDFDKTDQGNPITLKNETFNFRTFIDPYDIPASGGYIKDDLNIQRLCSVYTRFKLSSVHHVLNNFRMKKITFNWKKPDSSLGTIEKNYALYKYMMQYDTNTADYEWIKNREIDPTKVGIEETKYDYMPIQYFIDRSGTINDSKPPYKPVAFSPGHGVNYRRKIVGAHSKLTCFYKLRAKSWMDTKVLTTGGKYTTFMEWVRGFECDVVPPVLKARIHIYGNEEFETDPIHDVNTELYVLECDYKVYYNFVFGGRKPQYLY